MVFYKYKVVVKFKIFIFIALSGFNLIVAQDLEPRSLSSVPVGGNFMIGSYGYSVGNILVDNTMPIEGLNSTINSAVFGYARSFKLFNKIAKVDAIGSYSFGRFDGKVNSIDSTTSRSGIGDPMLRFSVILLGDEAVTPKEFSGRKRKNFKLGVSLRMKFPLGQYNPDKLLNLGMNRWAFKAGVSASYIFCQRLIIETQVNSWFFTENKDFFGGNTIYQKPLMSFQLHTIYIINPKMWAAVSFGSSAFGETVVNGIDKNDNQNNSRYGLAFSYRLNKSNSIKLALTGGVTTRYGSDYTSILAVYQFLWFDKKKNKKTESTQNAKN